MRNKTADNRVVESAHFKNPIHAEASPLTLHFGTKLGGRYEIRAKPGAGGMGEVYLAEDGKLAGKVAIKFLNEEFSRDPDKLRRLMQEAKAASALNHQA